MLPAVGAYFASHHVRRWGVEREKINSQRHNEPRDALFLDADTRRNIYVMVRRVCEPSGLPRLREVGDRRRWWLLQKNRAASNISAWRSTDYPNLQDAPQMPLMGVPGSCTSFQGRVLLLQITRSRSGAEHAAQWTSQRVTHWGTRDDASVPPSAI